MDSTWLQAKISESPLPLQQRLRDAVAGIDPAADMPGELFPNGVPSPEFTMSPTASSRLGSAQAPEPPKPK